MGSSSHGLYSESIDISHAYFIYFCTFISNSMISQGFLSSFQGNLLLTAKQAEAAVVAFRGALELRPDIRSYQGATLKGEHSALPLTFLCLM
jgi:hypothetical protein